MDTERQAAQVDLNYDAFVRELNALLPQHRDRFALMRDGLIVAVFDTAGSANRAGYDRFPDEIFSIQEVTNEPIDLGFWSHVATN